MLVDYSDSSSESDEPVKPGQQNDRKRKAEDIDRAPSGPKSHCKNLPSLPDSFLSLYSTPVRAATADDPSLHGGRTRQVPHVVGNWPTHVYLEWYPSKSELAVLDNVTKGAARLLEAASHDSGNLLHSFLRSDLAALLPLHISLSAPLVLKTEQRDSFQESISTRLAKQHLNPFTVDVTGLEWVANHDKSRFFLVLKLGKPENNELNDLLVVCNASAQEFGLPQLYDVSSHDDPGVKSKNENAPEIVDRTKAFHISIAWSLREPDHRCRDQLIMLEHTGLKKLKVKFAILKLKIGNAVIDIPL